MVSAWGLLLAALPAHALDIEVQLRPADSTLPALRCVATDIVPGVLLSASVLSAGEARLTPLVSVEGLTARGEILWRTAVKSQQPGLISLAYPTQGQAAQACPADHPCTQHFDRQEQSLTVAVTFQGTLPASASAGGAAQTWSTASWYRSPTPLRCTPEAP